MSSFLSRGGKSGPIALKIVCVPRTIWPINAPVSYTHLDVYKRQGDDIAVRSVPLRTNYSHSADDSRVTLRNCGSGDWIKDRREMCIRDRRFTASRIMVVAGK